MNQPSICFYTQNADKKWEANNMMADKSREDCKPKALKPEDIVVLRKPSAAVISPDGKWAAFVLNTPVLEEDKSEYRGHIWLVSTEGGEPLQLTNGPNGDTEPQWSPDSKCIAFVSKRDGEKSQVWVILIAGGEARQLTYTKNGATNPRWSPDGKRIAFLMQEEDSKEEERRKKSKDDPVVVEKDDFKPNHLWFVDIETLDKKPRLLFKLTEEESEKDKKDERDRSQRLTEGNFHVVDLQWSPDSKEIAFVSAPSPKSDHIMFKSTIHIISMETKTIRKLTSNDNGESFPRWSPDGKWIAFLYCTDGANILQKDIYIIPAEGGTPNNLTRDFDHNEFTICFPEGDMIYFETADGVRRHIYAVPKCGGDVQQITSGYCITTGISIAKDGDMYICYRENPSHTADIWAGSIHTEDLKQITKLNPQIQDFKLGETRIVKWRSYDGLEIEGLLCLPVEYQEGMKCPLIVEPHGGPHGAIALGFNPTWQFFSGEGFATFSPNFRGSDGYGRGFAKGNYQSWGVGDYQDIMTGVDHLVSSGIADPKRMVVSGWSYGGYMTAWMVTQTDQFKAASNGAGLSNLVSMYAQNDIPSYIELYFEGSSPYQRLEDYLKHSPISHICRTKTPTLILHGAEDKRVPLPQAEEFYTGLKAAGAEVEFVKYPREGHNIGEPRHLLDLLKRQLEWYRKYIPSNADKRGSTEG